MSKVNIPIALLSITISVLMWASIYNNENRRPAKPVQKLFTAPLTPTNFDRRQFILTDIPTDVPLSFAGTAEELQKVQPTAIVDLANSKVGVNQYQVLVFPTSIRNLMTSQQIMANIKVDRLVTKEVEVRGNLTGLLPDGKRVQSLDVFPKHINVSGTEEALKRVEYVQASVDSSVALSSVDGIDTEARAVDASGVPIPKVLVSLDKLPEYSPEALEIPVHIRVRVKIESETLPTTGPDRKSP